MLLLLVAAIGLGLAALVGDDWGQLVVLAAAGVLSLGVAWISRRRQAFTAASWLSAAGALLISFCFLPAIALLGYQFSSNAEAWVVGRLLQIVVCGAVCWWLRSKLAGALAVAAWVALPAAMAFTGSPEGVGWHLPLSQVGGSAAVWEALTLMLLAAAIVEVGSQFADRRGWIGRDSTQGAVIVASTVLGAALVSAGKYQGASWFCFVLVFGAVVLTSRSIWKAERTWLSLSGRLFSASSATTLFHILDGSNLALAMTLLALTFLPFAPQRRRLTDHWSVRLWEGTIWLNGLALTCAFAAQFGPWLSVQ